MAKFNVVQKRRRAQISDRKRALHGDPKTKKLKKQTQPQSLSGKRKRKLLKKWRRVSSLPSLSLFPSLSVSFFSFDLSWLLCFSSIRCFNCNGWLILGAKRGYREGSCYYYARCLDGCCWRWAFCYWVFDLRYWLWFYAFWFALVCLGFVYWFAFGL